MAGLGGLVASLLGAHLGDGHEVAALAQPALDLGLLAGTCPQAGGEVLAGGAIGLEVGLERLDAGADRRDGRVERRDQASSSGLQGAVGGDAVTQARDPACALGALALGALGHAALGCELAVDLGTAHRRRAFERRLAALGDEPRGAPCVLLGGGERARAVAADAVGLLARRVGGADGLLGDLAGALRDLLGGDRRTACGDQLLAAVALGEHALLAALGRLAQLAVAAVPDAAVAGRGDAVEAGRQVVDLLDDPGIPQQAARRGDVVRLGLDEVAQVPGAGCRRVRRAGRAGCEVAGDEHATAIRSGGVEQRFAVAHAFDEPRPQQAAERRGDRALIAGAHVEGVGERADGAPVRAACGAGAQELVTGRELCPDARRLAPGGLERAVGCAALAARRLRRGLGAREQRPLDVCGLALLRDELLGLGARALQRHELALELGFVVGSKPLELGLQRGDPLATGSLERGAVVVRGARVQRVELGLAPLAALAQIVGERRRALKPQLDALGRRARPVHAPSERLALLAARGKRLFDRLAARRDLRELRIRLRARRAGRRRGGGCRCEVLAPGAGEVAHELPASLDGLALDALVQLGGLRLTLERTQPRARLALDVERAVEVVLRALQLELRAPAALAVLAEPGGLLDEQPPLARLGRHDRLDAALRDDRVHLLAQAGIAEDLEDVDETAARAVEAVLAFA